MRRFALVLAAVLVAAPVAVAADTDRVVLEPGLSATITTVPFYARSSVEGNSGSWRGPTCAPRGRPDLVAVLALSWAMGVYRASSAQDAGEQARTFAWKTIETTTVPLPHVVGGRTVGMIPALLVLTDSEGATGYHESSIAFHLLGNRFVAAKAWARGNALSCVVEGDGPVADWHRRVAREALPTIRIEGNLPPARISVRRVRRTARGAVADVHGHPLVGASVALERRRGARWRVVSRTRTSARGTYVLPLRAVGTYRVAARAAGTTGRSRAVRY